MQLKEKTKMWVVWNLSLENFNDRLLILFKLNSFKCYPLIWENIL